MPCWSPIYGGPWICAQTGRARPGAGAHLISAPQSLPAPSLLWPVSHTSLVTESSHCHLSSLAPVLSGQGSLWLRGQFLLVVEPVVSQLFLVHDNSYMNCSSHVQIMLDKKENSEPEFCPFFYHPNVKICLKKVWINSYQSTFGMWKCSTFSFHPK